MEGSKFNNILAQLSSAKRRERILNALESHVESEEDLREIIAGKTNEEVTNFLKANIGLTLFDASALAGVLCPLVLAQAAGSSASAAQPARTATDLNTKLLMHIKKKVDKIDWIHEFVGFCPWLDMTETDRSRANNLRKRVFAKLGISDATATCWVTGKHVAVKNSHILPDSTRNKIMQRLELDPSFRNDVEAVPSNFMILDVRLENAFDSMKISFSPVDMLHTEKLVLKIWNPACRDDPVEVGTTAEMQDDTVQHGRQLTTIGDYEGFPLNIPASWRVSRIALSYHTLCCYIYQKYKGNLSIDEEEPADFSSQTAAGRDTVRRQLAERFKSSIREDDDDSGDSVDELDYNVNEIHEDRSSARAEMWEDDL